MNKIIICNFFKSKTKQTTILTLLFVSLLSTAQTKTITGIVSDTLSKPLESANVIAISSDKNAQLKFAIADNKGTYKLELDAGFAIRFNKSYNIYIKSKYPLLNFS